MLIKYSVQQQIHFNGTNAIVVTMVHTIKAITLVSTQCVHRQHWQKRYADVAQQDDSTIKSLL